MNSREKYFSRLLYQYLPAWSSLVGYPVSAEQNAFNEALPSGLLGIPLDEAPVASLHGFYVDYQDAPDDLKKLATLLETLLPGGAGILHLPGRRWKKKELLRICQAEGLLLKSYRSQRFQGICVVVERTVLPIPAEKKLSVIVPCLEENLARLQVQLGAWQAYLQKKKMEDDAQIVLVIDGPLLGEESRELEKMQEQQRLVEVRHYRAFGPGRCVRTGILHASGRRILIDESGGQTPPGEYLPLLAPLLQSEPDAVIGFAADVMLATVNNEKLDPGFAAETRLLYHRALAFIRKRQTGSPAPNSDFRLYTNRAAWLIALLGEEDGTRHRLEELLILKEQGLRIETTPVERVTPKRD